MIATLARSVGLTPPRRSMADNVRDIKEVLSNFRETRANEFAAALEKKSELGALLAEARIEARRCRESRDAWRDYSKTLERLCLGAGLEMPKAPDESGPDCC